MTRLSDPRPAGFDNVEFTEHPFVLLSNNLSIASNRLVRFLKLFVFTNSFYYNHNYILMNFMCTELSPEK